MALEGYGSASGWGGMNDAYLEELPQYDYGKTDTGKDFTYGSGPLSASNPSDPSGSGPATYVGPTLGMNPQNDLYMSNLNMDYTSGPKRVWSAKGTGHMGSDRADYSLGAPQTTGDLWKAMQDTVYNPGDKTWEPSGKYSYPYSQLFPERSDMIGNIMGFGSPSGTTDVDLIQDYANAASNHQQNILDFSYNNPTATQGQLENFIHEGAAPATSSFHDMLDQLHGGEPGSSSDFGAGAFGFNKGGQVSGGK